jgi:hypothetical protein
VIAVLTIGLTFDVIIPNAYSLSYSEQVSDQKNNMWHLGKNLSIGDSYTYKICDPDAIQTSAANYHYFTQGNENHNSSVCYIIKMDFVNLLNSDENLISGDVWVVQAAISDVATNRDDVRYSVFHVDSQTFEVRSADTIHPDTIKYSDSLQRTLFSLFKYTATEPQLLQIGTSWGEVTEALHERGANPHMTVLDDAQEYSVTQNNIRMIDKQNIPVTRNIADAFKVGYEIDIFDPFIISDDKKKKKMAVEEDNNNDVTNYFLISSDLPFPLSAISYSPVHIVQPQKQYEFELVAFLANNNNIDLGTRPVFEEPKENTIREIPTETGTIELTFPSDVVVDDIVTADDDIVVDVVSIYDDVVVHDDDVVLTDDDIDHISVYNTIQSNDIDYAKIAGLVVLLVVMIAVFLVFKKFKESGFKTELKKTLKKKQQQHIVKEIVSFDDKLHIDIKTITNVN